MPYDQFITWQVGGDLNPQARTKEQILATGVNSNINKTPEEEV